jgi:hypothetical protein
MQKKDEKEGLEDALLAMFFSGDFSQLFISSWSTKNTETPRNRNGKILIIPSRTPRNGARFWKPIFTRCSIYGRFTYIYSQKNSNVGKYSLHHLTS